jgi:MSHA biogenesis protein MshQ
VARNGTVTLRYNGWTWLPSTTGRVTFGSKRSPVIYVRELYF